MVRLQHRLRNGSDVGSITFSPFSFNPAAGCTETATVFTTAYTIHTICIGRRRKGLIESRLIVEFEGGMGLGMLRYIRAKIPIPSATLVS
jgi:hypothetical protein